ncbi:MAG: radical SAM protein, partial [Chloroflexi bacterium]|nr:radical SAM protein [Chloroflexota bacterium]
MTQAVLLINSNIARPPVSPVGLEYVAQSLADAGFPPRVLDFAFQADWRGSLAAELHSHEPLFVGLSVRNTDDCSFPSQKSFLPWISEVIAEIRKSTAAPIILGGVGFSTMPDAVVSATQADGGIDGDGEEAVVALARSLANGDGFSHLPNMVYRHNGQVVCNPRAEVDLRYQPAPRRRFFDNRRYEQLGAAVGVETKRGCSQGCTFCADPVAKGRRARLRPPEIVAEEFRDLADQGVSWFHLGDSEFNLPPEHAKDLCRAIIRAGLSDRIRWYGYASPVPFDRELVDLMKHAGCAGVNFGVDSLCDAQLCRLGRAYSSEDVGQLARLLNGEKITYIFDLLIGGPGETRETVQETIDRARQFDVPLVGMAAGVRIYPKTALAAAIANGSVRGGLHPEGKHAPHQPVFYLSPSLGDDVQGLLRDLVGDDQRFLLLSTPGDDRNYNYADDEALCRLIEQGARGAYWDILWKSTSKAR